MTRLKRTAGKPAPATALCLLWLTFKFQGFFPYTCHGWCSSLLLSRSSPLPRPPGGLSRGRWLDPLPEGRGLASLQKHLPGVVRHGARGRPVQRRHHGAVRLRHPALRLRARRLEGERRKRKKESRRKGAWESEREREKKSGKRWVENRCSSVGVVRLRGRGWEGGGKKMATR